MGLKIIPFTIISMKSLQSMLALVLVLALFSLTSARMGFGNMNTQQLASRMSRMMGNQMAIVQRGARGIHPTPNDLRRGLMF